MCVFVLKVEGSGNRYGHGGANAQHGSASSPHAQNAAAGWKGQFSRGGAGELESFDNANAAVLNAAGLGGLLKDLEGAFSAVNAACNELAIPVNQVCKQSSCMHLSVFVYIPRCC